MRTARSRSERASRAYSRWVRSSRSDVAGDPGGVRFDGDGDRAAAGNGCGGQDPVDVVDGAGPPAYAVYVDEQDVVWLSDFGADTVVRFDPVTEAFTTVEVPGGAGD